MQFANDITPLTLASTAELREAARKRDNGMNHAQLNGIREELRKRITVIRVPAPVGSYTIPVIIHNSTP